MAAPRAGLEVSERLDGLKGASGSFRAGRKGKTWPATAHGMAAPRAGLAGFVAAPGAGLEVSERLEGLKGASAIIGPVEKERLGLPQPIVWQLQEPV